MVAYVLQLLITAYRSRHAEKHDEEGQDGGFWTFFGVEVFVPFGLGTIAPLLGLLTGKIAKAPAEVAALVIQSIVIVLITLEMVQIRRTDTGWRSYVVFSLGLDVMAMIVLATVILAVTASHDQGSVAHRTLYAVWATGALATLSSIHVIWTARVRGPAPRGER